MKGSTASAGEKPLRSGFTTGACAAAAAKAAARLLVVGAPLREIDTTLPNGRRVSFVLRRCERTGLGAICSVVKDAGDDPDCTHGAEITAEVWLEGDHDIRIEGGSGVGRVTRPGLGLEVGGPAVNPVPRRNIAEMVREEIGERRGARVRLSVPGGEEMAKETLNGRLGIVGGISILGTTGIVQPFSTSAWRASVIQQIDVARARGHAELVFTTGGKSEQYAMKLLPHLDEEAFIQVGDFIGVSLRYAGKQQVPLVHVAGMIGKLSKMADGRMQTHAAGSEVNMELLARLAAEEGASDEVQAEIHSANTARHVLEICAARGCPGIATRICREVVEKLSAHVGGAVELRAWLVDFNGALIGHWAPAQERTTWSEPRTTCAR